MDCCYQSVGGVRVAKRKTFNSGSIYQDLRDLVVKTRTSVSIVLKRKQEIDTTYTQAVQDYNKAESELSAFINSNAYTDENNYKYLRSSYPDTNQTSDGRVKY